MKIWSTSYKCALVLRSYSFKLASQTQYAAEHNDADGCNVIYFCKYPSFSYNHNSPNYIADDQTDNQTYSIFCSPPQRRVHTDSTQLQTFVGLDLGMDGII